MARSSDQPFGSVVLTGTHEVPFTRLFDAIHAAVRADLLPKPVLGQTGAIGQVCEDDIVVLRGYVEHFELRSRLRAAKVVVVHGGPGSIFDSLDSGHLPIAFPRMKRHNEAVDDHQVAFVRLLEERQLLTVARDETELLGVLRSLPRGSTRGETPHRSLSDTIERFDRFVKAISR